MLDHKYFQNIFLNYYYYDSFTIAVIDIYFEHIWTSIQNSKFNTWHYQLYNPSGSINHYHITKYFMQECFCAESIRCDIEINTLNTKQQHLFYWSGSSNLLLTLIIKYIINFTFVTSET